MKTKKIYFAITYILFLFMPLHTMLVDKVIGRIDAFHGLANLWRDVLILVLFLAIIFIRKQVKMNWNIPFLILVIGMICVFAFFTDAPKSLAFNMARIYCVPMFMAIVLSQFEWTEREYGSLIKLLFLQGIVLVVFGYIQVFILGTDFLIRLGYGSATSGLHYSFYINGWHGFQRLVATFASPNNCALYLTQIFAVSFLNRKRLMKAFPFYYIGLIIILAGIVGTFSRSSWLAVVTMLVIYFLISHAKKIPQGVRVHRLKWIGLLCIIVALGIAFDRIILDGRMISMALSSVGGVVNKSDASFLKHVEDLTVPIKILGEHPMGLGFGTNGSVALSTLGIDKTHLVESSIWLMAYELGIIGAIIYYIPFAGAILGFFRIGKPAVCYTASAVALVTVMIFLVMPLNVNFESTFLVYSFIGIFSTKAVKGFTEE